jgi:hypothetical protein
VGKSSTQRIDMKIYFSQIYIEAGVTFPFSHHFQLYLSEKITALLTPSSEFVKKYGEDWSIMIRISAKRNTKGNEIKGPSVFKKSKDVEFTVFLPFDDIANCENQQKSAIEFLLQGLHSVLESLGISTENTTKAQANLVSAICADPKMLKEKTD